MVKERRLTDWQVRLEEIVAEIERVTDDVENMDAQGNLESICGKIAECASDLEDYSQEYAE